MSIRSKFCDFDKETRKYIKKRDNNKCIFCGNNGALQIAHIFLSRAHGGKGCKENGVMLCIKCHQALDNGKDASLRDQINQFCRAYLIEKENIIDLSSLMKTLKYDKINAIRSDIKIELPIKKIENKCKDFCSKHKINITHGSAFKELRHKLYYYISKNIDNIIKGDGDTYHLYEYGIITDKQIVNKLLAKGGK